MVEREMKKASWWIENGEVFHADEKRDQKREEDRRNDFLAQKERWGADRWDWVQFTSQIKWGLSIATNGDGNREWQLRDQRGRW